MCGLYGFVSHRGVGPDSDLLNHVARLAERRGPHAHGIAWADRGRLFNLKAPVPFSDVVEPFVGLTGSTVAVLGHCRLSTTGDNWQDTANNQPLVMDQTAISHNGIVADAKTLADLARWNMKTQCDSEVLLQILNEMAVDQYGNLPPAIITILERDRSALMWIDRDFFGAYRHGQPLWCWDRAGGTYFCSVRPDEDAKLVPNRESLNWLLKTNQSAT